MELELLILIFFIVFLIVILLAMKKRTDRLNLILESLGLQKSFFWLSYKIKKKYKNEPVYLMYSDYSDKRSSKQYIEFAFLCQSDIGFSVKLCEDTAFLEDKFGVVKTGQLDFDNKFIITSNHPNKIAKFFYLHSMEVRKLIEKLFTDWVKEIELDGKYLKAKIKINAESDLSLLKELPEHLLKLREMLMSNKEIAVKDRKTISQIPLYLLYSVPIFLSITAVVLSIHLMFFAKNDFEPMSSDSLILKSLILFFPVALLYLYYAFKITMMYPASYKKFTASFILTIIWFSCSIPFVQAVNGFFDKSSSEKKEYIVVNKYAGQGDSYYLLVETPEKARKNIKDDSVVKIFKNLISPSQLSISVKREEYLKAKSYYTMASIYVRKGSLGIKWIEKYQLYRLTENSNHQQD